MAQYTVKLAGSDTEPIEIEAEKYIENKSFVREKRPRRSAPSGSTT
jgi:hypothetical protein